MCNIFCLDAFYSCFLTSKLHENNVDRNSGFMSPSALILAKMKKKSSGVELECDKYQKIDQF